MKGIVLKIIDISPIHSYLSMYGIFFIYYRVGEMGEER